QVLALPVRPRLEETMRLVVSRLAIARRLAVLRALGLFLGRREIAFFALPTLRAFLRSLVLLAGRVVLSVAGRALRRDRVAGATGFRRLHDHGLGVLGRPVAVDDRALRVLRAVDVRAGHGRGAQQREQQGPPNRFHLLISGVRREETHQSSKGSRGSVSPPSLSTCSLAWPTKRWVIRLE